MFNLSILNCYPYIFRIISRIKISKCATQNNFFDVELVRYRAVSFIMVFVDFVCQDGAYCGIMVKPSAANKGQPMVNYHQSLAFDHSITTNLWPLTNIYYVMIIVTSGFSKKSFFINIMVIS